MKSIKNTMVSLTAMSLLLGCSTPQNNTLGSLKYKPQKEEVIEFKKLNHQEVRAEYKEILDLFEDKQLKEQIERRIADVYMMEGVYDQKQVKEKKSYYVDSIKAYRNILEKYPDSPDNAEVLYQLAKAYDLDGDQKEALKMLTELTTRHPYYVNIEEAYFRKGDIHFSNGEYALAEQAYTAVTQQKKAKLAINANYMLGWAYYKQAKFDKSINAFAYVLDQLLPTNINIDTLNKTEKPLATDSVHSMSLALDRIGGSSAIAKTDTIAAKPYVWLIYQDLGEYYLEKELYEDSATTFRLFVTDHKSSDKAPLLHTKLINTYIKGGFPRKALEEKEAYVNAYGIYSKYEGNHAGMPESIKSAIKIYLDELARYNYNEGQSQQKIIEESTKNKDEKKVAAADEAAVAAFNRAAVFYQQYVDTFPNDARIDEIYFLKAESLFLAKHYVEAAADYERVAYQAKGQSAKQHTADSGYAVIISYQKHIATLKTADPEIKKWQAQAVDSMLRFAKTFDTDARSPSVLTNAADYLFGLTQYQQALQVSSALINNNPQLDKTLKKTAYGIMAHSYFKLGDYQNAENSYALQRELVDSKSEEYTQISERLATTIYKKSEGIINKGEKEAAIEQLLKIKRLTPDATVRVPAQFDAATMLLELKAWPRAIAELKELIALYPTHELSVQFPRKLAFAYEKNENWALAATSYLDLSKNDSEADVRREALFIAATMFEKNNDYRPAIEQFKIYDTTYQVPFDSNMEARYHLATIYEKLADVDNQLQWLTLIVNGDKKSMNPRTDRSKWLGAWATMKYGDYYASKFTAFKLYLPLLKSLPEKNKMLDGAVKQYQLAADYGILEFLTMSSFKIANLYQQFAIELRNAPKPVGMSGEDQKTYADIIEEQAAPFDNLAIELHQANIDRAWSGKFNEWIDKSFDEMKKLMPARFNKPEMTVSYGDEIR